MKILLLAEDIGITAPGRVFNNICNGISSLCDLFVVTSSINSINVKQNYTLNIVPLKKFRRKIKKIEYTWFKNDWYDSRWYKQIQNLKIDGFDYIISCISFAQFAPLLAGEKLSQIYECKHVCYCVDAIPAPIGWLDDDRYYRALISFIRKHLSNVDALFMTNKEMLDYQTRFLCDTHKVKKYILYNPTLHESMQDLGNVDNSILTFLYAGQLYAPRTPRYLLSAFEKLSTNYDNVKLIFLGTKNIEQYINNLSSRTISKISILPFDSNPETYYKNCIALLDIGGDINEDVFLSSKITSYLCYNRIIICESGENSPSRNLFGDTKSIRHCGHSGGEFYEALLYAIDNYKNLDFCDRNELISDFSVKNVAKRLIDILAHEI